MNFSWAMGDAYLVRYNFAVNNQTYSGEASFAERPASKIVVEYEPENPNNNRAEAGLGWSPISIKNLIWFGVVTLILFVVGFIKATFDYFFRGKSV